MEINVIIEQGIVMKFLIKSRKTNAEIKEMLRAVYRNATLNHSAMYEWIGWFREGQEDVCDDPRAGQPRTARQPALMEKVQTKMDESRRQTVRDVAASVGVSC